MTTFRTAILACGFAALSAAVPSLWAQADLAAVLQRIDTLTNIPGDFTGVYTAIKERAGEKTKVIQARMSRRDSDDKFLILVSAPQAQKGQGYLKIGANLWFYDPQSRLFSHSSLRENWEDSDAMNSDFFRTTYARDYRIESWQEGTLDTTSMYILELQAATNEVAYPFKKLWVQKDMSTVLKAEDYSLSRMLMRTAQYPSYTRIGEQYIPLKMIFIDELNKGNRTQLTLSEASITPLPNSMFTKSYLERVSR